MGLFEGGGLGGGKDFANVPRRRLEVQLGGKQSFGMHQKYAAC
jgi:hypothetical protein